jgi:hypothetical protein
LGRLSLTRRHFDLAKQRHYLLRAKPLLRHDQAPFQDSFYQTAWSKRARSGQIKTTVLFAPAVVTLVQDRGFSAGDRHRFTLRSRNFNLPRPRLNAALKGQTMLHVERLWGHDVALEETAGD